MINVHWSRASEKKEQFPLSCPQAAAPRRGSTIGRSCIVATLEGKSLVCCVFPIISCQPRLRTLPGWLGETQAATETIVAVNCIPCYQFWV
jgi:hypothetical protein